MGIGRTPSYLVKQSHGYCFRLHVPPDLSPHICLREVRYSLGTTNLKQARLMAGKLSAFVWGLLENARSNIKKHGYTTMNRERIKKLIYEYFQDELKKDEEWRLDKTRPYTWDELEGEHLGASDAADRIKDDLSLVDLRRVSPQLEEFLREKHVNDISPDSTEFKILAHEMLKAQYSILQIIAARTEGDFKREGLLKKEYIEVILGMAGDQPIIPLPEPKQEEPKKTGPRLSENLDAFFEEKKLGKFKEGSQRSLKHSLDLFRDIVNDPPLSEINFEVVRDYFEKLKKLPNNMSKMPEYSGKSIQEIINMEIPEEERIAIGTINGHIRWIKQWGAWAARWGYTDKNYTEGLKQITKPDLRVDEERDAFSKQDLIKIFNSPEYRNDTFDKPYKFWMNILALYTGARQAELAQLDLEDVQVVDDTWCIKIQTFETGNDAKKRLKTKASKRNIPIHDFLIKDLKLLDYVDALGMTGATRLFPELPYRRYSYGSEVSRWFQKYRDVLGLREDGRKLTFHSYRHTLETHLKQQEANQIAIDELIGHSTGASQHGRYGKRYPADQLKRMTIDKIDFGLDLSHLKRSKYVTDPHRVAKRVLRGLKKG